MSNKVFANPTEFALFMQRAVKVELFADTAARTAVAVEAVRRVKERIGDAQALAPELAEATQAERVRLGYAADATLLRRGDLRDSYKWEHVSARKTVFGSDDPVALWQELGVDDAGRDHSTAIPARYPLTRTVAEGNEELFHAFYFATFNKLFEPR